MKKNKKKPKQDFRFSVDQIGKGKFTKHTTHISSKGMPSVADREDTEVFVRSDHDFVDEVVINGWFHLEAMSRRSYWMNIAGVTVWVYLRKDGTVKQIHVYEPGEYDEPWEGIEYGFKVAPQLSKSEAKKVRERLRQRNHREVEMILLSGQP